MELDAVVAFSALGLAMWVGAVRHCGNRLKGVPIGQREDDRRRRWNAMLLAAVVAACLVAAVFVFRLAREASGSITLGLFATVLAQAIRFFLSRQGGLWMYLHSIEASRRLPLNSPAVRSGAMGAPVTTDVSTRHALPVAPLSAHEHDHMTTTLHPVGTFVLAIKKVGPISDGQPGVVTGIAEAGPVFWRRPVYLCTFLGNVKVAMNPSEVDDYAHGYSREQLEQPEDRSLSVAEQLRRVRPIKD
jgi:hypothetical protein